MFGAVCFLCLYGSMATGAHQQLIGLPIHDAKETASPDYLIWKMLADKATLDYDMATPFMQITIVARSTRTQYDYELWMVTSHEDKNTYDAEFFWAIEPSRRTWMYLGTYSIMYIFMLCGIGYGGRWIEVKLFTNDYDDETFYGGIAVYIRTWAECATWWTIDTMTLTTNTMWKEWKNLYLPWDLTGASHSYGKWSWHQQGMPRIPIYKPWQSYKKMKMVLSGGNNYAAEPNQQGVVPMNYINKILKLWSERHYPSRL